MKTTKNETTDKQRIEEMTQQTIRKQRNETTICRKKVNHTKIRQKATEIRKQETQESDKDTDNRHQENRTIEIRQQINREERD